MPEDPDHVPVPPERPRRGGFDPRLATLYALGALVIVLVAGVVASFVVAAHDRPHTAANRGDALGLVPLGKGPDLLGRKLPDAGLVTLDGKVTDLRQLTGGKPTLVNFFSRSCVPCVKEMPALEAARKASGDRLHVVGVAVGDSADDTRAFVASTKVTYPIVRDPQSLVLSGFSVGSIPTTIAVDASGTIVDQHFQAFDPGQLKAFIAKNFPTSG